MNKYRMLIAGTITTLALVGLGIPARAEAPDLTDPSATPCPAGSAHDNGDGYCVLDCDIAPTAPIVVREWFTDGTFVDTPGSCPTDDQAETLATEATTYAPTAADVNDVPVDPAPVTATPAAVVTVGPAFTG